MTCLLRGALLLFGWLAAAAAAAPAFDPSWSHLSAGAEIPELGTSTSRTCSNGDGAVAAELRVVAVGSGHVLSQWMDPYYVKIGPDMCYDILSNEDESWAKFDLSPIPDNSSIIEVVLHWYQYEILVGGLGVVVTQVDCDPETTPAEPLFGAIRYGQFLSNNESCEGVGWKERALNERGRQQVTACLGKDWVVLGISERNHSAGARGYGTEGESLGLTPHLHVVYAEPGETDIQALHAELLTYPMTARGADTASLTLRNNGPFASGTFWACASLGDTRESTLVKPIAVGESVSVRVAIPATPASDTMLDYRLWSSHESDLGRSNDSAHLQCWSFPPSTYAAEGFDESGFPPSGWAVADSAGGTSRWTRVPNSDGSHSGSGLASCMHESAGTSDDWLIGATVHPSVDCEDSAGFFARSVARGQLDYLEAWGFSARRPPVRLLGLGIPETTYYRYSVSLDACDGDTVRIAFRYWTTLAVGGLRLDDVWFSGMPRPPRDAVQRTVTQLPDFAFTANPSRSRTVTVRSALAVGERRRLTMRDVVGRAVRTFTIDAPGIAHIDLRDLPPGVYMATLDAGSQSRTRKLVLTAR